MQDDRNKIKLGVTFVLLGVSIVLLIAWTTGPFFYHFASNRLVNIYSPIQIFATAYVSFLACRVLEKEGSSRWRKNPAARPFFVCAVGFFLLGLDEVLSIHENLDKVIHFILRIKETPITDHLDDVILFMYGLVAICFIRDFIREFKRHPYMIGLIICGLFLFFMMTGADYISNNDETFAYFFKNMGYGELRHKQDIFKMVEESLEVLGEASFLAAFTAALVHVRLRQKEKDEKQ